MCFRSDYEKGHYLFGIISHIISCWLHCRWKNQTSQLTPVNCVGVFNKTNEQVSFTAKDVDQRLYSPDKPIDSVDGWIDVKDVSGLLCEDVITANED